MIDKYEYIKGKKSILKELKEQGIVKHDALFWSGQICSHIETLSRLVVSPAFFDEWELMLACKAEYDKIIYDLTFKAEVKAEK